MKLFNDYLNSMSAWPSGENCKYDYLYHFADESDIPKSMDFMGAIMEIDKQNQKCKVLIYMNTANKNSVGSYQEYSFIALSSYYAQHFSLLEKKAMGH